MSGLGALRLPLRTAAMLSTTLGMYGVFEIETLLTERPRHQEVLRKWMGRYGSALLDIYGISTLVRGADIGGGRTYPGADERGLGRIFVMNHRSGIDILLCIALFEASIVSRADLARWPLVGSAARRVGTLFVDRASKRSGASVLRAMDATVRAGRGVMIFPEGTTFAGDEVRPFKPGAFQTAHRTSAEVVPVGVAYEGDEAAFLDESFATHLRRVSGVAHTRVSVVVGDPLRPKGDTPELSRLAHAAVQELVHRARAALTTTSSRRT